MEILYLLIPLSVVLVAIIVTAFLWAIRSGQFDDLEGPAHRILLDDDEQAQAPSSATASGDDREREAGRR